eukprot:128608-Prymnesium_polylepis.1
MVVGVGVLAFAICCGSILLWRAKRVQRSLRSTAVSLPSRPLNRTEPSAPHVPQTAVQVQAGQADVQVRAGATRGGTEMSSDVSMPPWMGGDGSASARMPKECMCTSLPTTRGSTAVGGAWWEAPLPDVVVTRYECRAMPRPMQERFAAAVLKMRENMPGVPGSNQYFKLAAIHGGFPPLTRSQVCLPALAVGALLPLTSSCAHCASQAPEYCVHGREAFPGWHRAYILAFERMMRRADMALGGDGAIGLPYWDWSAPEVHGEVLPRIVRDVLMREFEADFFPVAPTPTPTGHRYRMSATRGDVEIRLALERAG